MANQGEETSNWFDVHYSAPRAAAPNPRPQPQHRESTWQSELARESFGQPPAQEVNAPTQRDIPMRSPQPSEHENVSEGFNCL